MKREKEGIKTSQESFQVYQPYINLQLILKQDDRSLTYMFCDCKISQVGRYLKTPEVSG